MTLAPYTAVDALRDYLAAQMPTYLRALETELSLTASSLTDPVEVIDYEAPQDNRSPLIQVFETDFGPDEIGAGQDNGVYTVRTTVVVCRTSDADLSGGEVFMRRYVAALLRAVIADPGLSGRVTQTVFLGAKAHHAFGDQSAIRHIYEINFEIGLQSL